MRDCQHRPVHGAVVHLESLASDKIKRPPVVTRADGRYAFLVERGDYRVRVELPTSDGTYREAARSTVIHVAARFGHVHQNLMLE